jgi:hypothetical protein
MWIDDVKDSSIIKEIVRIDGPDERDVAERFGLASGLAIIARARNIFVPEGFGETLASYADEQQLIDMFTAIDELVDELFVFIRDRGVALKWPEIKY